MSQPAPLRIAFVVPEFPVVSETFIINQVADLIDQGVDVTVFTRRRGRTENVSGRHETHRMAGRTVLLDPPESAGERLLTAPVRALRLLAYAPATLVRVLAGLCRGRNSGALRLLFNAGAIAGRRFSVVHCHFGDCAAGFMELRRQLRLSTPVVTTFYGYDASRLLRDAPRGWGDALKSGCSLFYVMSRDMHRRLVEAGFPPDRIRINPVSIAVDDYPLLERTPLPDGSVDLLAVGRLVEKKGFDVLLEAFAIARQKSRRPLRLTLVGDGPLGPALRARAADLGISDSVDFRGSMRIEDILGLMMERHILVSPSRTAADGDME